MFTTSNMNIALDIILIVASIWMVMTVRGIGGAVGKTLTYIVIGTVIMGFAHLQATLTGKYNIFRVENGLDAEGVMTYINYNGTIHRVVVLVGFLVLVYGFRQLQAMKR